MLSNDEQRIKYNRFLFSNTALKTSGTEKLYLQFYYGVSMFGGDTL